MYMGAENPVPSWTSVIDMQRHSRDPEKAELSAVEICCIRDRDTEMTFAVLKY